jgi:DNA-directed RNA polymerase subunit RPC12/RpoP
MDVDGVRIACPACGRRLTVMPRVQYLACTQCGSEYLVQRRGSAVGLEPFAAEQFEISKSIATVEKAQGEGCTNVFFWIFLVAGIFFCGAGYLGRTLFHNNILFISGWIVSLVVLVLAAGVLMRVLNQQRAQRLRLEAKQRELYEMQTREDNPQASQTAHPGPLADETQTAP